MILSSPASKNLCRSPALTFPTFFSYQPSPGTCDKHNLDFEFVKKLWFFMAARTPGCDHLPFLNTCPMLAAHEERTSAPSDSLISTFSFCLSSDNVFSFPALAVQRCITIPSLCPQFPQLPSSVDTRNHSSFKGTSTAKTGTKDKDIEFCFN